MDLFSKIEKISEKYIEGIFKNKFSGRIQPVEIARYLAREMRDKKTVSLSKVYVPNRYRVYIGEKDWETITAFVANLIAEMQEFISKKATEKNYSLIGLPVVEFQVDKSLTQGNFRIDSKFVDDPMAGETGSNTLVAHKKLEQAKTTGNTVPESMIEEPVMPKLPRLIIQSGENSGVSITLGEATLILGRMEGVDILIPDDNVSRKHAQLEFIQGKYYITDLDSTNGTLVNGVKIRKQMLTSGDHIKLGTTILEFQMG